MSPYKLHRQYFLAALAFFFLSSSTHILMAQDAGQQPPIIQPQLPPGSDYDGVYMAREPRNTAIPYNFTRYYGNRIRYFIDDDLREFTVTLNNKTYSINVKEYLQEALQEWKTAIARQYNGSGILLDFEEVKEKTQSNLLITEPSKLQTIAQEEGTPLGGLDSLISKLDSVKTRLGVVQAGRRSLTKTKGLVTISSTGEAATAHLYNLYNARRSYFPQGDESVFIETVHRIFFKTAIGEILGLSPAVNLTHLPVFYWDMLEQRIRMVNYIEEAPSHDLPPPIMVNDVHDYLIDLFQYRNGHGRPSDTPPETTLLLTPEAVGIAPQEAAAIVRAVDRYNGCLLPVAASANDTQQAGPSHRDPRSVPSSGSGTCPGTFDDIVAGDIRTIKISKTIGDSNYSLQTTLDDGGYYNTKWGKDTAHPLNMIALSNLTKMENVPAELGEIDYIKINLNDQYKDHRASLASYYYKGTGGFGSGVDSDARDAIYLKREQDLKDQAYGLIHYLVRIRGGKVAPKGERFFIATAEHAPWNGSIQVSEDNKLCFLTHYAAPQSDNNQHTGLSEGQYNAQFKCRSLNIVDPLYDQAEVSISQEVIARGLDYFIKNRQALDFSKTYSAYLGMINPRIGKSYRGYCGWLETIKQSHLFNAQIDCGLDSMGEIFNLKLSEIKGKEKALRLSIKSALLDHGQWGLSSRNYHAEDYSPLPWLGEKEYSLVFVPNAVGYSLNYYQRSDGSGYLLRLLGHIKESLQYSAQSGRAIDSPRLPFAYDLKLDGGFAQNRTDNPPDPALVSIILK